MKGDYSGVDSCPFNVLSLCSGVGGIDAGLRMAVGNARTVCYVEREAFCVRTLVEKMGERGLDEAPVWTDLLSFDGTAWRGVVDCVTAGIPCTPFSHIGKREGVLSRDWLWPSVLRIVSECAPSYVFLENVRAILSSKQERAFGEILSGLASLGFDAEWDLFSPCYLGAPHTRPRMFLLAHANGRGCFGQGIPRRHQRVALAGAAWGGGPVAGVSCPAPDNWEVEPGVGRVADGVPDRVDRIRAMGNSASPQSVCQAWTELYGRLMR